MDELDLALVNALQLDPRAPWSKLAGPLGVDAATLSRRWSRLIRSGAAWVTCYSAPSQVPYGAFALVEVGCDPGRVHEVAAVLAGDSHAITIEHTTGGRDLMVTLSGIGTSQIGDYVLERVAPVPGVTFTRTHMARRMHRDGSRWRLDSLNQDQRRDLERSDGRGRPANRITPDEARLVLALGADGRRPYAALADDLGRSQSHVRRMLASMLSGDRAVLRCDGAHIMMGWSVTAHLFISVPPQHLERIADTVATLREPRMVCSIVGESNLITNVWTHSLDELAAFEERLCGRFPEITINDRALAVRYLKRVGRILDHLGRSTAFIPMNPMAPVVPRAR